MQLTNNTILITGGSSGIGLEMSRQFLELGNKVLICGRSVEKLTQAERELPGVVTFACDLSVDSELNRLHTWIANNHPSCNVLINNAAIVHKTNFRADAKMIRKAKAEIQTNLIAPIALTSLILPILESNKNPSIINITTGLVYTPRAVYPIYNATKAGLHAFTQTLRLQLKGLPIGVIEVLMTVVDTPWHQGNAPKMANAPEKAVAEMMRQLQRDHSEIRIGKVKLLYYMSRLAPAFMLKKINGIK